MRILTTAFLLAATTAGAQVKPGEWLAYGRDAFGSRFSPLTQITRDNVSRLEVAWTYRTGEMDIPTRQPAKFEATPLMVDGTLYLSTPLGRVIALDPETGKPRWTYDAKVDANRGWGDFANRGVSTWVDPRATAGARAPGRCAASWPPGCRSGAPRFHCGHRARACRRRACRW